MEKKFNKKIKLLFYNEVKLVEIKYVYMQIMFI